MNLPENLLSLLRERSTCYIATTMTDGSPQITQTWVDTDGENVVINSVEGFQKIKNMERDPRVAVTISNPANPSRYVEIRGLVLSISPDGGAEHIEMLAQKYLGTPYPWFGGRDQTRVIITIEATKINTMG